MAVMPWKELLKWLNLNTGFFETSKYTFETQMPVTAGNYDGAGMSHGNMQYNYAYGNRLNELYLFMFDNHYEVIRNAFGTYTSEFATFETVTRTYTQTEQINWANSITDFSDGEGRKLLEPWKSIFANVLVQPELIEKYLEIEEKYYIPNPLSLFKQLNCDSRAALASLVDLSVNRGRYYPIPTLLNDFDAIEANTALSEAQKEAEKIRQINLRGNDPTNGINVSWWTARRECMANQGGTYFGALYDPETQFNITQDVAIKDKFASMQVNLGALQLDNVYMGNSPIKSLYLGENLIGNNPEPFVVTTAPITQFRTNPNSYLGIGNVTSVQLNSGQPLYIDITNWVAARVHYTTDGSTPTVNSPKFHEKLTFTAPTTLKILAVSVSGVTEAVKTLNITITPQGFRYIRYIGHGDNTGVTSRLVELEALEGTTNRLLGKSPISGQAPSGGGAIAKVTDGLVNFTSGEYPFWWVGEGVPTLVYDLGATYPLTQIRVVMYSPSFDPRQTQFIVAVSPDNVTWTTVADYTANTTPQPTTGFTFNL